MQAENTTEAAPAVKTVRVRVLRPFRLCPPHAQATSTVAPPEQLIVQAEFAAELISSNAAEIVV